MQNGVQERMKTMTDEAILDQERTPESIEELQRLIKCYQIASRDDKNVVWAALNKYLPFFSSNLL